MREKPQIPELITSRFDSDYEMPSPTPAGSPAPEASITDGVSHKIGAVAKNLVMVGEETDLGVVKGSRCL